LGTGRAVDSPTHSSLAPGKYTIEVIAIDLLTNQTVTRAADFTLVPAPAKPNRALRPPAS